MQRNSKVVLSLILIVVVAATIFYTKFLRIPEVPRDVLASESYPEETTIKIYQKTPTGFPHSLIAEDEPLDYSGVVTLPGGKAQTTVSYVSNKDIPDIRDLYIKNLLSLGWRISQKTVNENISIIKADKGAESLLLSMAPVVGTNVLVTFQYEK